MSREPLDVAAARARIEAYVHRTPILTSSALDDRFGGQIFFKCENFQRSGAFKVRGAFNALLSLSPDRRAAGVVTSSSGNQAAAISLAARTLGTRAYIAMPQVAVRSKVAAVERYGGEIIWVESDTPIPTAVDFDRTAAEIAARTGAELVHPYDDPRTIAGQATCAAELLDDVADLQVLLAPVGGGGLLAGACLAAQAAVGSPVAVVGCEPAGADDAARSLAAGRWIPQTDPHTLADGLRTSLGDLTYPLIAAGVEGVVTVGEDAILMAMRLVWETLKIVIEPSAAVPVAALLENAVSASGRRVGVILSGGNVDLDSLPALPAVP